jgi:dolichol-phosphate mannosyltransferase
VHDLPLEARYAGELSSLSPWRILCQFPGRLLKSFFRRVWYEYFQYDFGLISLLMLVGGPLLVCGFGLGVWYWVRSIRSGVPATGGQVMLSALPILAAVQMLIQALALDMTSIGSASQFGKLLPDDEALTLE